VEAGALIPGGLWLEFISFPCLGARYSMPLGVSLRGGRPFFRIYRGVGFERLLAEAGMPARFTVMLLSPRDPLLFLESYLHRLEHRVPWACDCPSPRPELGSWLVCKAELAGFTGEFVAYECSGLELAVLAEEPGFYSRALGCMVELLVVHSKLAAGVETGIDAASYARGLAWCIERSAPERHELHVEAERLVQAVERASRLP
jgi:hypothetical protein